MGLPQNGAVYLNAHLNNGNSMFDLEDFGEKQTKAVWTITAFFGFVPSVSASPIKTIMSEKGEQARFRASLLVLAAEVSDY